MDRGQKMVDTKIYVCTHKDFQWDLVNKEPFTILNSKELPENKYSNIEYSLAEIYHLYNIYTTKLNDSKYIGLNQYRKIFDIEHNNLESDLKNYDIILPSKLNFHKWHCRNVYRQLLACSSKNLFDNLMNVVRDLYPEYSNDITKVLYNKYFYAFNMFIMSSDKLGDYCKWLYSIIDEYLNRMNFWEYENIYHYVDTHRNEFPIVDTHPNPYYASVKQSTRIIGGYAERLFHIYIHHNFKNIKEYDFIESGEQQKI